MEIKPSKSRSISIVNSDEKFNINGEAIPTLQEKPIQSLGRWYNAELKDTQQVEELRQNTINGLKQIDSIALPGKLKLWCFQFGLLPRLMWPKRLERLVNTQVSKWLGYRDASVASGCMGMEPCHCPSPVWSKSTRVLKPDWR